MMERKTALKTQLFDFFLFGGLLVVGSVGAINIDVTINGNHVNSIPSGSNVTLNCSVPQGDTVDRFDWLKDNQPVSDHVVIQGGVWWSSLVLQNVSPVNTTAWYTCRTWRNNSTNATLPRHVCVEDIVLQVQPRALFVDAGDGAVITCTLQARCEVLSLQWFDPSGNNIIDKQKIESTSKRELKLKLVNVKQKDEGSYYCRAIDSAGREVKKEYFDLLVREVKLARPPSMKSPHQHVTGYHGNNVTLAFSTQHTPRAFSHGVWKYEGRVLHASPKYTVHSPQFKPATDQGFFSMTVHNLTEDDSGNYTLQVTTSVTPPAVGHVQLTVHRRDHPPVNSKDVNISCEVEHPRTNETPRFYWTSDGKKLTPQSAKFRTHWFKHHTVHSNLYTMVLTIFSYEQSDCRWYICGMNTSQGVKEKLVAPCPLDHHDPQDDEPNHEPPTTWLTILLAISFICTAGVATGCFLFKKYNKKTIYKMPKGLKINKDVLQWDLFISYTSKDFEWVSKKLLPLLEDNSISYSIHSKDFEVGKTIVDNMADSVYNCQQIVAVLSESYVKSKFCRAELDMAVCRHVTMNGTCLTIITLDDISEKKLPKNFGKRVCVGDDSEWGKQLLKHLIPLLKTNSSSIMI